MNTTTIRPTESLAFDYVATYKQVSRKFNQWHDVAFYQIIL